LKAAEKISHMRYVLNELKIKTERIYLKEDRYFDTYKLRLKCGVSIIKVERALKDIGLHLKSYSSPTGYAIMREGVYCISVQKKEVKSEPLSLLMRTCPDMFSPILLGVDISGAPLWVDLQKLPHLLMGGTTGSGKSMLLHSMILSALSSGTAIYLADPKQVEFSIYEPASLVRKIDYSVKDVYETLNSLCREMESRFRLFKKAKVRNVVEFNNKSKKEFIRPIIYVIDEWADLVLEDKKLQEKSCVLTQKSRAAGISVILSTQRPSAKVISGLIKVNFPGRISLKVPSYRDSLVILDRKGGESIVDIGAGLFHSGTTETLKYFRAPYIANLESEAKDIFIKKNLVSFWKKILLR